MLPLDRCLAALGSTLPSLTAEALTALMQAADDPRVVSALSSPGVLGALSEKARATPGCEEELTEVLLSQQVLLAASRSQPFLEALVASPALAPLLDYLLGALLRLPPENRVHTVFVAMLINFTRCGAIARALLGSPGLPDAAGRLFATAFAEPTAETAPLAQRSLYLLTNVAAVLGEAPPVARLFAEALAANRVGDRIVDAAAAHPGLSLQCSQLLHNVFLMLRPPGDRAWAAAALEPLAEHVLLALVCERSLGARTEPRGPGLTPEERAALPARVRERMAGPSARVLPGAEALANLSDCLLLLCHTARGRRTLQGLGTYPLLRELHLSVVEALGDRGRLADSLLTVIEGLIAEDLDGVN